MEGDSSSWVAARLPEGNVGNDPGAGENTKPYVPPASETSDCVDDVETTGDFEDVGAHGGVGFAGDDDWGLGLVLRARWAASGTPDHFDGGSVAAVAFNPHGFVGEGTAAAATASALILF